MCVLLDRDGRDAPLPAELTRGGVSWERETRRFKRETGNHREQFTNPGKSSKRQRRVLLPAQPQQPARKSSPREPPSSLHVYVFLPRRPISKTRSQHRSASASTGPATQPLSRVDARAPSLRIKAKSSLSVHKRQQQLVNPEWNMYRGLWCPGELVQFLSRVVFMVEAAMV